MAWTPKYISTALIDGDNDGSTPANSLRGTSAVKTGMEFNWAAEIKAYYRRTCEYDEGVVDLNADILPTDDGTAAIPCYHIGWPRGPIPNTTITAADFTNGSKIIDNVVGITPGLRSHVMRWITAPNGKKYLITAILWEFTVDGMAGGAEFAVGEILTNTTQTRKGKVWAFTDNLDTTGTIQAVVDSATAWVDNDNITSNGGGDAELSVNATAVGFLIDREYAGSTVTGINGKFQIEKDEDYDDRPQAGIDAGWDADSHDLPRIDFNDEAYQLLLSGDNYFSIRNFYFENSADVFGIIDVESSYYFELLGCVVKQSSFNGLLIQTTITYAVVDRCYIEGSGAGTSQRGLNETTLFLKNSVICNCGDNAIRCFNQMSLWGMNNNFGVEMANGDNEIEFAYPSESSRFIDCALGGTNGYVLLNAGRKPAMFENFQKVLGSHKSWFYGGTWESVAVTSTAANKKLSDIVFKVLPSTNFRPSIDEWKTVIFEGEFELPSGMKTIKFWIYNNLGQTLNASARDNIYLRALYVDSYDDTSEYTQVEVFSTETNIADAASADDWKSLSVAVNPSTASKVRVQLVWSGYSATDYFLIDPRQVVS